MIKVEGKATQAKVFTNIPAEGALAQIKELIDQKFMEGTQVRVMPDYHAGKGCVIGTTIQLNGRVVPNLVGVDVGCGVAVVKLREKDIDFEKLDNSIRSLIPSGKEVHEEISSVRDDMIPFHSTHFVARGLSDFRTNVSLGTLGGGK